MRASTRPVERGSRFAELDWPLAAWRLLCGFAFVIPFSIFLAQLMLILTAVAAAVDWHARGHPRPHTPLDLPIACFIASALLGSILGLDPLESFWGMRSYLQVVIVYLVWAYADSTERALRLVRCFLLGSAIAAGYTALRAVAPTLLPRLFLGQMTQSGQLLFAIGLCLPLLLGRVFTERWPRIALVLYLVALVCNLKRGVWLGVTVAVATVGLLTTRRLMIVAGILVVATVTAVPPVRSRITNSTRDLLLPGNRADIWLAAVDVVRRFPMGVGRKNGEILRDYPNIPRRHKHAHNNLLQITLENGYVGLAAFAWWMIAFGVLCWRTYRRAPTATPVAYLAIAIFSTYLGFHVAGLVEYNFGDSEVLEIFFVTMGLGLVADQRTRHGQ